MSVRFTLALLALAACEASVDRRVPGAEIAPLLGKQQAADACAIDVTWYDGTMPDVRYVFDYDALGRLAHAQGLYTRGGPPEHIEYTWDNLDRLLELVQRRGTDPAYTTTAHYTTLGDLLEYTQQRGAETQQFRFADFTDAGQPTKEVITQGAIERNYVLEYDAFQRIVRITPDVGMPTLYTYDDDARTLSIDSNGYRGLVVFDEHDRTLSESWTGDAPGMVDSEDLYEYEGARLLQFTMRSGTQDEPHVLRTLERNNYRYDCTRPR